MLTARNIHVIFLGLILGSAAGYIYASARTEARRAALAVEVRDRLQSAAPGAHPEVTDAAMLEMFAEAIAAGSNDPELLRQYATLLFDARRFGEAAAVFDQVLDQAPDDAEIRTYMATSLYAAGERERAMEEFSRALEDNPDNVLALHNVALGHLDLNGDVNAARQALDRILQIEPDYEGLASLQSRIAAAGGN
jgi:tetratricopeptide (TPR) repeat protein